MLENGRMTRGLVFDFDGLILDTEQVRFESWQEVFAAYGEELPLSLYLRCVGSAHHMFSPYDYLEERIGKSVDRELIGQQREARNLELCSKQKLMPGVADYLVDAQRLGLRRGVASSSPRDWVEGHLERLGLLSAFETIKCREDVAQVKPAPALYRAVLEEFGLAAEQVIAFEDSLNGVLAAQRCGLFCVAVPNGITRHLPLDAADVLVSSLAELPLAELICRRDPVSVCES